MKNTIKILIVSILTILLILGSYFFIINGIQTYQYEVTVGNHIGMNVDTNKIYFGTVPSGERSKRNLVIRNTDKKSKVHIKSFGDLSDKILVSDNNFIMEKNEVREIELIMQTDYKTKLGKHNGKIVFLFSKI